MHEGSTQRRAIVRNLLLFLGGAGLASALLFPLLRRESPVAPFAEATLAQSKTCQVLFVGPSYVKSQIDVKIVDAEARIAGAPIRSCKFGVEALRAYELELWLERLMDAEWPVLELVVIDVTLGNRPAMIKRNHFTRRTLDWHTLAGIPAILGAYLGRPESITQSLPNLRIHLAHVFVNRFSVGQGAGRMSQLKLIEGLRPSQEPQLAVDQSDEKPGPRAKPLRKEDPPRVSLAVQRAAKRAAAQRKKEVAARQEEKLAEFVQELNEADDEGRRGENGYHLRLREIVRARGAETLFLFAPVGYVVDLPDLVERVSAPLMLMNFNDPRKYPELFRLEVRKRGGPSHLNSNGTELYSKLIAREIARQR